MKPFTRCLSALCALVFLCAAGCQKEDQTPSLLIEGMENCAVEPDVGMAAATAGDTTRMAVFTTLKIPRSDTLSSLLEKEKTTWLNAAQKALDDDETMTSIESTMEVTYNQAGLLSILRTESRVYQGAAYPTLSYSARTFSLAAEKELSAKDLILTDGKASSDRDILQLVSENFTAQIEKDPGAYLPNAQEALKSAVKNYGFYLAGDQLMFFLPAESVAPHAAGMSSFGLPYSNASLFAVKIPAAK